MEWHKVMGAGKQKIFFGGEILGILNRAFSELLKVKGDIYSHLLSQHAKNTVARC